MKNAADLLLELVSQWPIAKGSGPESGRHGSPNGLEFWSEHARAVSYLVDIERDLELAGGIAGSDAVGEYLNDLPGLYRAIFGMSPRWGDATRLQATGLPEESLRNLKKIAAFLRIGKPAQSIGDDALVRLRDQLTACVTAAASISSLTDMRRGELIELLGRAISALDSDAISDREFRSVLGHASAEMLAVVSDQSTPASTRETFKEAVITICTTVLANVVTTGLMITASTSGVAGLMSS